MVRSARTLRSMAALVSVVVERRARAHASGWAAGVGGRALYLSGGWPDLSVARHATRSAASAGHLAARTDVEHGERLGHRAAVRHARRAAWPRMRHRAGEHASRQPREVHARHMAEPAQLPARHVEVSRVQPEPAHQLVRCDAQAPRRTCAPARVTRHNSEIYRGCACSNQHGVQRCSNVSKRESPALCPARV